MTDLKSLIERLRNPPDYDDSGDRQREAADALEELEKWQNAARRFDAERFALRADLAEERRKREDLEQKQRGHFCVQSINPEIETSTIWKAKFEAAREVAAYYIALRENYDAEPTEGQIKRAGEEVDAEIEAKMREKKEAQ